MRVYLLLILFFASTVSARVRYKRDTNQTTVPFDSTTAVTTVSPENTTTKVDTEKHNLIYRVIRYIYRYLLSITNYELEKTDRYIQYILHTILRLYHLLLHLPSEVQTELNKIIHGIFF